MKDILDKSIKNLGSIREDLINVQKNIDQAKRLEKTLPEWEKQKEFLLGKEQEKTTIIEDIRELINKEKGN